MSDSLQTVSNQLASVVEVVDPGIVRVHARRRLPASGIVWSQDGIIVTAHHVVQQDKNIKIGLPGGDTVQAELVGRDPTTDLAVLRCDSTNLAPPAHAKAASPQVGNLVLALGRPGKNVQATLGIVSALSQNWRTPGGGQLDTYLQTDVLMYPGFSGGALVNTAGELIGMNSSALLRGVSTTVTVSNINRVTEMLLTHGRVKRGYLGVSTQPVRLPALLSQKTNQETGLLLVAVEPNSPADEGGLLLGDTIVALANSPVRHHDDLLAILGSAQIGSKIPLRIIRGGQVEDVYVVIGEQE